MKKTQILSGFIILSLSSFAISQNKTVKPQNTFSSVVLKDVEVVEKTTDKARYTITAIAMASNPCAVPLAAELFIVVSNDQKDLSIVVANVPSNRICTAEYAPVDYRIDLGTYTQDNSFDSVKVNTKDYTP